MPLQGRNSTLVFLCPVEGCSTTRSNSSGRRGPAEMNRHVRTSHPDHKHQDIVYRACLLEDNRGLVLTHYERYLACEGAGVPIDSIHTLEPGFTAMKKSSEGSMPSAKRVKADRHQGEQHSESLMTLLGPQGEANIQWALDHGHSVDVRAMAIRYTPGKPQ